MQDMIPAWKSGGNRPGGDTFHLCQLQTGLSVYCPRETGRGNSKLKKINIWNRKQHRYGKGTHHAGHFLWRKRSCWKLNMRKEREKIEGKEDDMSEEELIQALPDNHYFFAGTA